VRGLIGIVVVLAGASAARAEDAWLRQTREAWAICQSTATTDPVRRMEELERGMAIANAAIAANPRHARAHFALFCNQAKQLELAGLSWRSLERLRLAKATLEQALALAPDDPDILAAKGEMLRQLPSVLGGDTDEAERLFRRALERDPNHLASRLFLAKLLVHDERSAAAAEVARAVELADQHGTPEDRAVAHGLAEDLGR
jgi:cytochrome c-type biogenesis protein CcmH/NrfG